jgi:hypothetical protein
MVICPLPIVSRRLIVRMSVDLPDPEGPMRTTTSPLLTVRLMSLENMQVAEVLVDLLHDDEGL